MKLSPIILGLVSALLFGAATPASKLLLAELSPFQLAGILYLGAALGISPVALGGRLADRARLGLRGLRHLVGAVIAGGVLGPLLLLFGLAQTSSGDTSLLLNLELAATAVLGVVFFREHLSRLGFVGVAGIVLAGALLSGGGAAPGVWGGVLIGSACICWGLDNHWTALIDDLSPAQTTLVKGTVAGLFNLGVGLALAPFNAGWRVVVLGLVVGALSYGVSITLYVESAQRLGPTRAQGLFACAPFIGAALSVAVLDEPFGIQHGIAALILVTSVFALQRAQHEHSHSHREMWHAHAHSHDEPHHQHPHDVPVNDPSVEHAHWHRHAPLAHVHPHVSDLHHRHEHCLRSRLPIPTPRTSRASS